MICLHHYSIFVKLSICAYFLTYLLSEVVGLNYNMPYILNKCKSSSGPKHALPTPTGVISHFEVTPQNH